MYKKYFKNVKICMYVFMYKNWTPVPQKIQELQELLQEFTGVTGFYRSYRRYRRFTGITGCGIPGQGR